MTILAHENTIFAFIAVLFPTDVLVLKHQVLFESFEIIEIQLILLLLSPDRYVF